MLALVLACANEPATAGVSVLDPAAEPAPPAAPSLAAASPPPPPPSPEPPRSFPKAATLPEPGWTSYPQIVREIESSRREFATAPDRDAARDYLYEAVTSRIIPAWRGTPWTFYGHAEAPGEEPVACGYWVASVLRDVGFRVDRDPLGRQASERILLTFAAKKTLRHFGNSPPETVVEWATKQGRGLWGVGLANHAGLLWNDGEEVRFCHSNYNGQRGPMCENALFSGPFQTNYTVVASMLADATVDAWIEGRTLRIASFGREGG